MTRSLPCTLLAVLLSMPVLAAEQSPAAQTASAKQASQDPVVVDVVVTDTLHHPVHNLAATDFKLFVNGQPQAIKSFEEHHAWEAAAPLPLAPNLPPNTFTNFTNAPSSGALDILLLDTLNTPMSAQARVRSQMLEYLKQSRPGTRMAILGLTSRLILLQGFTSDPELLSDVANGKDIRPSSPIAPPNQVKGDSGSADDTLKEPLAVTAQETAGALGNSPSPSLVAANLKQFEAESQSFLLPTRVRYTLDALNQLARSLYGLTGRKNLIWVSGSFPANIFPEGDLPHPVGVVAQSDELRETVDLLFQSRVAVYPIDVRGQAVSTVADPGEEGAMVALADATGGQVFAASSSLKDAVEKAIDAGSSYYTLTYSPATQGGNGEFRKILIDSPRPGLSLAYRRGYFAGEPNATSEQSEPAGAANGPSPESAMHAAAMAGGPDPTQIIFTATVTPVSAEPEPGPAHGNSPAEKTRGPYRRYSVKLSIAARDLACPTTPEGLRQCALQVAINVYDANGALLEFGRRRNQGKH